MQYSIKKRKPPPSATTQPSLYHPTPTQTSLYRSPVSIEFVALETVTMYSNLLLLCSAGSSALKEVWLCFGLPRFLGILKISLYALENDYRLLHETTRPSCLGNRSLTQPQFDASSIHCAIYLKDLLRNYQTITDFDTFPGLSRSILHWGLSLACTSTSTSSNDILHPHSPHSIPRAH